MGKIEKQEKSTQRDYVSLHKTEMFNKLIIIEMDLIRKRMMVQSNLAIILFFIVLIHA